VLEAALMGWLDLHRQTLHRELANAQSGEPNRDTILSLVGMVGQKETLPKDTRSIDSTSIKVQRSAAGGKGGAKNRTLAARAVAGRPRSTPSRTVRAGCSACR
jgi:hypothetical protein